MNRVILFNPQNPLNIDWSRLIVVILTGCSVSLMTVLNYEKLTMWIIDSTLVIAIIPIIRQLFIIINFRGLWSKLWNITNAAQLTDRTNVNGKEYTYNSAVIEVFSNSSMYRLDFHANGIRHSDNIYHLDNRITEAFESEIIDKHRYSWGMSYFVKK